MNFNTRIPSPEKSLVQERLTNLLFAQISTNITRVKAMTKSEILFEHLKGGDLLDRLLKEESSITAQTFQGFCITLMDAFIEITSKGFCYGDVKFENCFLTEDLTTVKLGDLGLTHPLDQPDTSGSTCYCAPEIFQGLACTSTKSDVYSFGIILYLYLYRTYPENLVKEPEETDIVKLAKRVRKSIPLYNHLFQILSHNTQVDLLQSRATTANLPHDSDLFKEAKIKEKFLSLIITCLNPTPEKRPTWEEIKEILTAETS